MLTESERSQLEVLASTALPAGRLLPAAGAGTIRRLETFLSDLPPGFLAGYRRLILALDAQSLLQTRTRFSKLPFGR